MDRVTKIALLRRKVELVAENTYSEEMELFIGKAFGKMVDLAARFPRMPDSALRDIDRELENLMTDSVLREDHAEVRDPLIKEFGISRLTVSPKTIVKRVLKRGSIQSEEEYYQIQEVVTCVDNIDRLGEEIYWKLERIAGAFRPKDDSPPRVRISTKAEERASDEIPRWPVVPPEGDDYICPPDTPLETLERFMRAKLSLLLRYFADPDDAANFASGIESGIKLVYGPSTASADRDFMMRYRDHELESFSGMEVTTEQLRVIELELQAQFGFRRLLPSPRRLGLTAIEKGKVEGQWVRLIIERAMTDFTAPPVFSTVETKKLRKLLKARPASPA